jgi:hypothetical protein
VQPGRPIAAADLPDADREHRTRWVETHAKSAGDCLMGLFARHDVLIRETNGSPFITALEEAAENPWVGDMAGEAKRTLRIIRGQEEHSAAGVRRLHPRADRRLRAGLRRQRPLHRRRGRTADAGGAHPCDGRGNIWVRPYEDLRDHRRIGSEITGAVMSELSLTPRFGAAISSSTIRRSRSRSATRVS